MYRTVFELIMKNDSRARDRLTILVTVGSRITEHCFKRDVRRNRIQITISVSRLREEFRNLISGNTSEG